MSIQALRDGQLSTRQTERAACLRRRSSKLRALNAVTAALTQHVGLPASLHSDFNAIPSPPLSVDEVHLLDANDLEKGRYFQDASIDVTLHDLQNAFDLSTAYKQKLSGPSTTERSTTSLSNAQSGAVSNGGFVSKSSLDGPAPNTSRIAEPSPGKSLLNHGDAQAQPVVQAQTQGVPSEKNGQENDPTRTLAQTPQAAVPELSRPNGISPTPDIAPAQSVSAPVNESTSAINPSQMEAADKTTAKHHDSLLESQKEIARREAFGEDFTSPDDQIRREEEQAAKALRDAPARMAPPSTIPAPKTSEAKNVGSVPTQNPAEMTTDAKQTAAPARTNNAPVEPRETSVPAEAPTRMRTRVSSGALRHRSVSEIISESPKNTAFNSPRLLHEASSLSDMASPKSTPVSRTRPESQPVHAPLKKTSPLPPKEDHAPVILPTMSGGYAALKGAADDPNRDYLEPLYRIQAQDPPNGKSLGELLHKASKAVSTTDQLACIHERQDHRILKRIYALQYTNHWSLRQMEPCPEPPAPKGHHDQLLAEMKWMRTDFRQERKAKKAVAKFLAEECASWVNGDAAERADMQIAVKIRDAAPQDQESIGVETEAPHSPAATTGGNGEYPASSGDVPPELEPSKQGDISSPESDDMPSTPQFATVPGSLFAAANVTDASQHLLESEEFTKAINELPLYTPFGDTSEPGNAQHLQPKAKERRAPPVSKFCDSKVLAKMPSPPKKRSRYDYEDDDDTIDEPGQKRPRASDDDSRLTPDQVGVALFNPEFKSIKERLHANTAFRPPSEFAMPSTHFYEFRSASQWTGDDDTNLRQLAKEYSFNWSLIADKLSLPSKLHGAAERRTPWECFERWVELETLPNEMKKTVYFRTWGQRMENANRNVDTRYAAQVQHHQQNPTGQPPVRRRTLPIRVEKRRGNRYLHLVDSMRKLARKREQQQHKQAEAQKAASLRKQHENTQPKSTMHTPQEFSRLRQERDVQIALRQERYNQQVLATQQKANQLQRSGQYPNAQAAMVAATQQMQQQQRAGVSNAQQAQQVAQMQGMNHAQANASGQHSGQAQQPGVQGSRGGHAPVPQMGMQGNIPQAQMQPNMRGVNGSNQPSAEAMQRMAMQSQFKNPQMQNQQYPMQQQQQQQHLSHQQQQPPRVSPGGSQQAPNGMTSNQMHNNQGQAMMAPMQGGHNGQHNSTTMQAQPQQPQQQQQQHHQQHHPGQVNPHNASASPMPPPATPVAQPQGLSSGHVPAISQIKHSLQTQNPNMTPAQIDALANEQIKRQFQTAQAAQARQNAINAASGSHGVISGANSYAQNQTAYQQNQSTNNAHHNYNAQASNFNNTAASPQAQQQQQHQSQQQYSQSVRQQLLRQQHAAMPAPNMTTNISPQIQRASPNMMHVSPNMQQAVPNMNGMNMNGQRPPSRSATPQMVRVPSSGGLTSPGIQQQQQPQQQPPLGSPRTAGVVRQG